MITNYLIELLKDNECVIVPEFGAFISKRHSAAIDYANHRFTPPYKEIVFNNKLQNDDELLVNFLCEKENISREDAIFKIQSFVNQSEAILDVNSELTLEGLGKIRKFGDDYVLTSKVESNLLGDSFGLTEFNMQPVFRRESYETIKEKIAVEQKEKNTEYTIAIESVETVSSNDSRRKPSLIKTFTLTTLAFLLFFALNWKTDQLNSNLASWNPFLYSSPNEFLVNVSLKNQNAETENLETENLKTLESENIDVQQTFVPESENDETSESEIVEVSEPENIIAKVEPEIVAPQQSVSIPHYFIIGGSFQTMDRAEICLNDIKKKGFENAAIIEKNDKGYIRVYYESFAVKSDALIRLDAIKNDFNESAWLLYQK